MDAQVTQVAVRADDRPLTWPKEADIICLFATVEGYFSYRNPVDGSWLVLNLCHQINQWLKIYEESKHQIDLEFHHLLIRVNAAIGKFQIQNCYSEIFAKSTVDCPRFKSTHESWPVWSWLTTIKVRIRA